MQRNSLLLLLSCFSRVQLCGTPQTAAHEALPSLGFSRQEHWSWLPFPSPMHESEKWKWSRSVVFDSSRPHWLQPIRLLHPWDFPGKSAGVGCHCLLRCGSLVPYIPLITLRILLYNFPLMYYFPSKLIFPLTQSNHVFFSVVPLGQTIPEKDLDT